MSGGKRRNVYADGREYAKRYIFERSINRTLCYGPRTLCENGTWHAFA